MKLTLKHILIAGFAIANLTAGSAAVYAKSHSTVNTQHINHNVNSNAVALVGATLVSPHIATPIKNSVVLIRNGVIESVGPASMQIPSHYQTVDLEGQWLVPGYIDSHMHFFQSGGMFTRPDQFDLRKMTPYEDDQDWVKSNLADTLSRYLLNGVTAVVDMGGPTSNFETRQAANNALYSPLVAVSGQLIAPPAPQGKTKRLDLGDPPFIHAQSPENAKEFVQQQLKYEPDMIKIVWEATQGQSPEQLLSFFRPAIELAHEHKVPVAIHAMSLANAKMAIKAGADVLVHGVAQDLIDDEFVTLIKQHKVIYMPTIVGNKAFGDVYLGRVEFNEHQRAHAHPDIVNSFVKGESDTNIFDQEFQMLRKYGQYVDASDSELAALSPQEQAIVNQLKPYFAGSLVEIQKSNLKRMYEEGVTLALGTDSGVPAMLHGGSLLPEMVAWKQAGVPLNAILKAVTLNGAITTGNEDKMGTIEVGKIANLVVLNKDPLGKVENFHTIDAVVKQGNYLTAQDITKHINTL